MHLGGIKVTHVWLALVYDWLNEAKDVQKILLFSSLPKYYEMMIKCMITLTIVM